MGVHQQVSSMELVQEIYQILIDKEETCHRTCFSLQLDGMTLDNFAELKNVEGLKEGSVLKVVEGLYFVLVLCHFTCFLLVACHVKDGSNYCAICTAAGILGAVMSQ